MTQKRNVVLAVTTRITVSLAILAVSIGITLFLWWSRPEPQRRSEIRELRRVVVMQVMPVEVRRQFDGFGTAMPMFSVNIPARVTAIVTAIPDDVLVGNHVQQGQLIARLDSSDFDRQVEIATNHVAELDSQLARLDIEETGWTERVALAERRVELSKSEFERVKTARQREAAKQRELDIAEIALLGTQRDLVIAQEELRKMPSSRLRLEAQKKAQQSILELAHLEVGRCSIISPIDGVIQFVDVEVGENVSPGLRIARVVNLERIEVPIQIPASARPFLAVGDEVRLEAAGNSRQSWIATVSRIAPEDDENTRSLTAFVELNQNPDDRSILSPGKFVRAKIDSALIESRWVVPRRAMRNDRILLIEDGLIISRRIDVDYQIQHLMPHFGLPDDLWLVLGEETILSSGAFLVVTPSRTLTEGLPVEAVLVDGAPPAALSIQEPSK